MFVVRRIVQGEGVEQVPFSRRGSPTSSSSGRARSAPSLLSAPALGQGCALKERFTSTTTAAEAKAAKAERKKARAAKKEKAKAAT